MRKTPERLAFEADRQRMRLEGRIVMAAIMNELEAELEEIHLSHNERGMIPRVTLDISDLSRISVEARKLIGPVQHQVDDDASA
jgi:hypothetical protein